MYGQDLNIIHGQGLDIQSVTIVGPEELQVTCSDSDHTIQKIVSATPLNQSLYFNHIELLDIVVALLKIPELQQDVTFKIPYTELKKLIYGRRNNINELPAIGTVVKFMKQIMSFWYNRCNQNPECKKNMPPSKIIDDCLVRINSVIYDIVNI